MPPSSRILVIDDHPLIGEWIALHLGFAGFKDIRIAKDAVDGIRMLLESPPDLVMTDIMMPHIDGLELLEAMHGSDGTRNIPVILFSSSNADEYRQKAKRFGACAFLLKPIDEKELVDTVIRVLADPKAM